MSIDYLHKNINFVPNTKQVRYKFATIQRLCLLCGAVLRVHTTRNVLNSELVTHIWWHQI
jgi:hypothetical protein